MDSVGILQKRTCSEEIDLVRKLDFGRQLDFARAAAKSAPRKRGATHGRPIDLAGTAPAPDTFRKNSTSRGAERGAENAHAPCHVIGRQPTSGCFRTPPEAPPAEVARLPVWVGLGLPAAATPPRLRPLPAADARGEKVFVGVELKQIKLKY